MAKQPIINGKVVERSYEDYRNDLYLVNRRYQRKLVWELNEKQAFIDSLANGYPVPLFLFAKSEYKDTERNEIIDGMQRLNAIFSFIENNYPCSNGEYFDLSTTALTKDYLDKGILIQKEPKLSRDICVKIVSYELPYSIYDETSPTIIDEVFRRINSNGKHLSRQEIRQAGVTNDFSQIVRSIATRIRGDVSHDDFLLLSQMQNISITKENSNGGIDPDQVFWVKENIITKEDLRQSVDEEQIADLLGAMLLDPIPPSNVSVLDEYYEYKGSNVSSRYQMIEDKLLAVSPEKLAENFFYIFDEIKNIFRNRNKTIIGHMVSIKTYKGPRYFQVLFLSLFDLLIKKEKKINDYDGIFRALENISSKTLQISAGGGWWTQREKIDLISSTVGVLSNYVTERADGDPMYYSYANELETILKQSFTENAQYDFKQGIHNLITGNYNKSLISNIFKTLTAMANAGKGAVGYVLLGIADNAKAANTIQGVYGGESIKVGAFYITGLDGEINKYYKSHDEYLMNIKNELNDAKISDHYKRQIGSKMRMVNYHGKSVLILRIICDDGAAIFDNAYYTRSAASNNPIPVSPTDMPAFFKKFL